jgi:hypothetical protein
MTTLLPKDADNNPIPALRLRDNAAHTLSISAVSARNSVPFNTGTKVVGVYATVPVFIEFGDNNVTADANSHYFPAGVYYDIAISGGSGKGVHNSYMAAIRSEEDGLLYISEKE